MAKNYTWHLTCETHDIDEWVSCQTTGNDAETSQHYIEEMFARIRGAKSCSRSFDNMVELTEETEVN